MLLFCEEIEKVAAKRDYNRNLGSNEAAAKASFEVDIRRRGLVPEVRRHLERQPRKMRFRG